MRTENLSFYMHELIINNKIPDSNIINVIKDYIHNNKNYIPSQDEAHTMISDVVEDRFLWLYIKYGEKFPHTSKVFNIEETQDEQNPRNQNQIEQNKQVFIIYDTLQCDLYTSNKAYNKFLKNFMIEKMKFNQVIIKKNYGTIEEFSKNIKIIKSINFTIENKQPTLFSQYPQSNNIFEDVAYQYGFNARTVKIDVDIKGEKKNLLEKLINLWNDKENNDLIYIKSVGIDEENIERIFNTDYITSKRDINVNKNNDGLFDDNNIKNTFINMLKNGS